jgi:hypothetical protein
VVSTPIGDVVNGYGGSGVVAIADSPQAFIEAIQAALDLRTQPGVVVQYADKALEGMSWDRTCAQMKEQIECQR